MASIMIGMALSATSYIFTTLCTGGELNALDLAVALGGGGLFGWISAAFSLPTLAVALINGAIAYFSTRATGGSISDGLFNALFGALSAFIPAALGSGLDDLAKLVVGVTAGAPVEMTGDMIEIAIDKLSDEQPEPTEDVVEETEEFIDEETSTAESAPEDEEDVEDEGNKEEYIPQPDPPECSGGSPSGPGDYIGPDKRPIAF